ncbi:MAG: hemerythrin domain-containing protein [Planctomycetota bacterium]
MARISLNLVAEQHDLIYHVIDEVHALLDSARITDVSARNRIYSRLHLLSDFLVEHFYIEKESFLQPMRRILRRRKNTERVLRGLRKLEREIDQARELAEAFATRYAQPHLAEAGSDQALDDIAMFIDAIETLLHKEDRLVIPLAERLTGRKSTRMPRTPRQSGAGAAVAVAAVAQDTDDVADDGDVVEGDGIIEDDDMVGSGFDDSDADETAVAESEGVAPPGSYSEPELVPEPDEDDDPDATVDAASAAAGSESDGDYDDADGAESDDVEDALGEYEDDPNETLAADDVDGSGNSRNGNGRVPGLNGLPGTPPGRIPNRRPGPGEPPRPRRRRRRRPARR